VFLLYLSRYSNKFYVGNLGIVFLYSSVFLTLFYKVLLRWYSISYFIRTTTPLYFVPFVAVLSKEIYLIFNQHNIQIVAPFYLFLLFLFVLISFSIVLFYKKSEKKIFSIMCFVFYV